MCVQEDTSATDHVNVSSSRSTGHAPAIKKSVCVCVLKGHEGLLKAYCHNLTNKCNTGEIVNQKKLVLLSSYI